jgi:hypothetical protein
MRGGNRTSRGDTGQCDDLMVPENVGSAAEPAKPRSGDGPHSQVN